MITATQIRAGNIIIFRDELHRVISVKHLTPGNWRGMVITKLKNLKTNSSAEYRFRSEDKVEQAFIERRQMEHLYHDDTNFYFMDTHNYEQISIHKDIIGETANYLLPNTGIMIAFHKEQPIDIELPLTVELKVTETEPSLKGATLTASTKPATLETGLVIQVPQFISVGEVIKVDTHDTKYVERVK
ncbi:MAG: elongation factor P [Nitrospinota bacterium]